MQNEVNAIRLHFTNDNCAFRDIIDQGIDTNMFGPEMTVLTFH